jgi:ubiquinol-cytochrome c reductase cytochrome c1 subunit
MLSATVARLGACAVLGLALSAPAAVAQEHAEGAAPTHFPMETPELQRWSFSGFFGTFDPAQLQRGLKVYREVCSACHGLELVAFRNLAEAGGPGYTMDQARAFASEFQVTDGPDGNGEMFQRPAVPSDRFPAPFENDEQAKLANNGAVPPDLSLIAKARGTERGPLWGAVDVFTQYAEGGVDYIHALLTGYADPPAGLEVPPGTYFNPYFQTAVSLSMPPPLSDGIVTYEDGSPETVDQYAQDVSAFLMWAAEPKLVERKRIGFQVVIFLAVFAVLMYLSKRKVWAAVKH